MLALGDGIVPVFHTPALAEENILIVRHVARGIDIGLARLQILIDHDAIGHFDAAAASISVTGSTPMPATTISQRISWPPPSTAALHRSIAAQFGHLRGSCRTVRRARCNSLQRNSDISGVKSRLQTRSSCRTIVTSISFCASTAATSMPMNPPPITTARFTSSAA